MLPTTMKCPKVTVHHIVSTNVDRALDAYEVRIEGRKVWRSGFQRSASAQAEYAKTGAHNYARSIRRALAAIATGDRRAQIEQLAREMLPAVVVERALAEQASEGVGASKIGTAFEAAFAYAENFFEHAQAWREDTESDDADDVARAVNQ